MDATLRANLKEEFYQGVIQHLRGRTGTLMSSLSKSLNDEDPRFTFDVIGALKLNRERLDRASDLRFLTHSPEELFNSFN